jgi:endonuclease YncB( thermonuclease family)
LTAPGRHPRLPALLVSAACLASAAQAACPIPEHTEPAAATFVVDGDTLMLGDRERVRLIGIDAPELGHDGAPDAPLADAARRALRGLIDANGGEVGLLPGRDARDRYGRRLAHVYARNGINLNEALLRQGLAYQVTIPPNDRFTPCYLDAETEARRAARGLWALPPLEAAHLPAGREGFARVAGRVESVRHARQTTWIDLEGALSLRIADDDLPRFDQPTLAALPGARIQVRGWLYQYRDRPRMRLRHPSAILPPE